MISDNKYYDELRNAWRQKKHLASDNFFGRLRRCGFPANTKHLYSICTTSDQRFRRWSNIVQLLYKCFVFAGFRIIGSDCGACVSQVKDDEICMTPLIGGDDWANQVYDTLESRPSAPSILIIHPQTRQRRIKHGPYVSDVGPLLGHWSKFVLGHTQNRTIWAMQSARHRITRLIICHAFYYVTNYLFLLQAVMVPNFV